MTPDIKAIREAADRAAHGLEHTDQINWRVLIGPQEVLALCDEVERLRSTINEFHHAVKDAGWHPGRTDDLLTDIIKAKGLEVERLRKDAARWNWLFEGDKVYQQFRTVYDYWDGSDGKEGFEAVMDDVMEAKP